MQQRRYLKLGIILKNAIGNRSTDWYRIFYSAGFATDSENGMDKMISFFGLTFADIRVFGWEMSMHTLHFLIVIKKEQFLCILNQICNKCKFWLHGGLKIQWFKYLTFM